MIFWAQLRSLERARSCGERKLRNVADLEARQDLAITLMELSHCLSYDLLCFYAFIMAEMCACGTTSFQETRLGRPLGNPNN